MMRKIIRIDEEKCNGCGACARACHESAIQMVGGKAKLMRDDYCDGLGDCLPMCPTGAISFEIREAAPYDEEAVEEHQKKQREGLAGYGPLSAGQCPGHQVKMIQPTAAGPEIPENFPSRLQQWPVQIKLAPIQAPYFAHANLLVAADCTAFAFGDFHRRFIRNHVVLIGCPKLDQEDYAVKLTEIIRKNEIKSVTVVRMEVPCCGGIEYAVRTALKKSEKIIPWQVVTISIEGKIIES